METLNHEPVTKQELHTKIAELDAVLDPKSWTHFDAILDKFPLAGL